jgi:hypothetical protein
MSRPQYLCVNNFQSCGAREIEVRTHERMRGELHQNDPKTFPKVQAQRDKFCENYNTFQFRFQHVSLCLSVECILHFSDIGHPEQFSPHHVVTKSLVEKIALWKPSLVKLVSFTYNWSQGELS